MVTVEQERKCAAPSVEVVERHRTVEETVDVSSPVETATEANADSRTIN